MKITFDDVVKMFQFVVAAVWLSLLMLPASIILYNLTKYLIEMPFKEWHITILWSLSLPITTIILFIRHRKKV